MRFEAFVRALLIRPHQARVSRHICGEDRGEAADRGHDLSGVGWVNQFYRETFGGNAACSPPTATRSPTRCPPKPCSPCPNSTACCRCPTRPCTLSPEARGGDAVPDQSVSSRGTRTILKGTRNTKAHKSWSSRDG